MLADGGEAGQRGYGHRQANTTFGDASQAAEDFVSTSMLVLPCDFTANPVSEHPLQQSVLISYSSAPTCQATLRTPKRFKHE